MQLMILVISMATNQEICSKTKAEATQLLETSKTKPNESGEILDQVRQENGRLKLVLSNIMKDYKSLQQQIDNMSSATDHHHPQQEQINRSYNNIEDDELVSLSLGRSWSLEDKNKDQVDKFNKKEQDGDNLEQGLALRLNGRSYDDDDSGVSGNQIGGEAANDDETRKDGKATLRSGDDENVLQQNPAKKARVSVRAICNAPTMNDGCQWRKYGQKKAKGNPCPRAYYRCTMSPSCPVRKHVQRCPENMSILITTYEGTHNHPLPPAATAMASTTSAAVSMLKASSSTSTTINTPPFFYVPVSTLQSHPTITLDLTTPSASSRYNKYSSTFFPTPQPTTYSPPACLNFSAPSSSPSPSFDLWPNHNVSSSSSTFSATQLPLPSNTAPFYQPYNHNMPHYKNTYHDPPHFSSEKIAAATKEITSNPNFQSALAAAISSIVGRSAGVAGTMESHLGAATFFNTTSTVVSSISQQAEKSLKFELSPLASTKGPLAGFPDKNEFKK